MSSLELGVGLRQPVFPQTEAEVCCVAVAIPWVGLWVQCVVLWLSGWQALCQHVRVESLKCLRRWSSFDVLESSLLRAVAVSGH